MRHLLAELRMSQAEFAKLAGVSPNAVGRWVKKPPMLAMRYLQLLADIRRLGFGK